MNDTVTKGPWYLAEVVSTSGNIRHLAPVDAEGVSLLTVVEQDGTYFAAVWSAADARLMQHAKKMLEVLEAVQEASDYWSEYDVPVGLAELVSGCITEVKGDIDAKV